MTEILLIINLKINKCIINKLNLNLKMYLVLLIIIFIILF